MYHIFSTLGVAFCPSDFMRSAALLCALPMIFLSLHCPHICAFAVKDIKLQE
jgi:hypothetical protein